MIKNILIFISGMITMFVLIMLVGVLSENSVDSGLTIFEQEGSCVTSASLKVFQTLGEQDKALAEFGSFPNTTMVLLTNDENQAYYDDLVVKIPKGRCAKQIGTYQYMTAQNIQKTVPVVKIK